MVLADLAAHPHFELAVDGAVAGDRTIPYGAARDFDHEPRAVIAARHAGACRAHRHRIRTVVDFDADRRHVALRPRVLRAGDVHVVLVPGRNLNRTVEALHGD